MERTISTLDFQDATTNKAAQNLLCALLLYKCSSKTFALMVITFSCYSSVIIIIKILASLPTTQDIPGLYILLGDIIFLYIFTDFFLVWENKHGKRVIMKLINTVLRKQVCGSDTPDTTTHTSIQQLSAIVTVSVECSCNSSMDFFQ